MKLKKLLAIILSLVTLSCSSTAFASSVGSVTNDPSIGEDTVQGAYTEYENVGTGNTQTDVYLTVDNSNIRVGVPTVIILDGTPNENGEYIGNYSVRTEGDMSGDSTLIVQPKSNTVTVSQTGKNDMSATINQMQTAFTAEEVAAGATTTGTATAIGLTAGSWNGAGSFEIGINSTSAASVEYFTWGEDADFIQAYESSDLSNYPGLTVAEENENSNYSYPDATAITGLTDEGIEWIRSNNGRLILPTFATSISDNESSNTTAALGRFNSEYGSELSDIVTYVYVPENISYIGFYAFAGLENLEYANVYAETIGERSFFNCDALTLVNFKDKVNTVGRSAFNLCINLRSVVGASNVESVGASTFAYCYKLESIDALSNCATIGRGAFAGNYSLESIGLTDAIQSIGEGAFDMSGCEDQFTDFTNCEYGQYATAELWYPNDIPEYTFTPCENEISHFAQHDPRWSQLNIGNTSKKYGSSGCGWCCLATVYNYCNETDLTPVDIVDLIMENDASEIGSGSFSTKDSIYETVELTPTTIGNDGSVSPKLNQLDDLQSLYDALADGKIVVLNFWSYSAFTGNQSGHSIVIYGVTEDGKLMCADGSCLIHNASVDPDYSTLDAQRLQEPYYFTVEPWAIIHSWDWYTIVSK